MSYEFDDANRLRRESGTDGAGRDYAKSYNLDDAGNRLSLSASQEQSDGTVKSSLTSYAYNELDWLTSQSIQDESGTKVTGYGYDANGAQTVQTSNAGTAQAASLGQVWDFEGHLRAQGAIDGNGQFTGARTGYSYDAAGMRLSQSSYNAAGDVTEATSGGLSVPYEHEREPLPL